MRYVAWLATAAALLGLASTQCLSENDNPNAKFSTDLSPISDFGFDLFRQFAPATSRDNFFFSPYSIWTAFVLAYFGTAGNTQAQLENALKVDGKMATYNQWRALEFLYANRQAQATGYTFSMANRVYLDRTLPVRQCLVNFLHNEIELADFSNGPHLQAANTINQFSSTTTKGRIPQIVSPSDVLGAAMVLVNTAYFKGTWQFQFKPSLTQPEQFLTQPGARPHTVPMMRQMGKFRYSSFEQISAEVLELPYSGRNMSMFLMLPLQEGPQGWDNMMKKLSGRNLRAATHMNNLELRTVEVRMPRFKMEQEIQDELKQALINIGIRDIFDSRKVDLTRFGPLRNVTLDKTIHKAFVEVNEEGTEAAAATALVFVTRSGGPRQLPVEFYLNRPFLFLIRDNDTQNILFLGAYKNPSTAQS